MINLYLTHIIILSKNFPGGKNSEQLLRIWTWKINFYISSAIYK